MQFADAHHSHVPEDLVEFHDLEPVGLGGVGQGGVFRFLFLLCASRKGQCGCADDYEYLFHG